MYKLADVQYASNHQFFVDGQASVADVYDGSKWRTILVGGFNDGGKGYYALDITIPDQPISLWEFTVAQDANVGLSFGRPIISKLINGTWVVMFTSGYNNANGQGYLYILNAVTGVQTGLSPIATGVGSASSPSGLREINNWVNNISADNTTQRVYGGDLLGNVWRFDVNTNGTATLLATLKDGVATTSTPQPITTRVELAEIGGKPFVYVGTGQLLGVSDLATTQTQSVYSFEDIGTTYPSANVRTTLKPMKFTDVIPLVATGPNAGQPDLANATRTIACSGTGTACSGKTGWVVDLPEVGERMNIDFRAGLGTLVFVTNVPASNLCSAGYSWLNYVDEVSGNQVAGASGAGVVLDPSSLAVGLGLAQVAASSTGELKAIGVSANDMTKIVTIPWASPPPIGKRISWRELVQ
jgi:Tfp pilus tip-associated adhesin PilY1